MARRPLLLAALILLLLAGIIGISRLGPWSPRATDPATATHAAKIIASAPADSPHHPAAFPSPAAPLRESPPTPVTPVTDPATIAVTPGNPATPTAGPGDPPSGTANARPPIRFIRSATITGTDRPTDDQRRRLHEAVRQFADTLHPRPLIMDADAPTTSAIPALLYARPTNDLTAPIQAIYLTLPETPTSPLTPAPKADN